MRQFMNKYVEEFRELMLKFASDSSKHGKLLYVKIDELQELTNFVKKVCEKAQMYDDLCD